MSAEASTDLAARLVRDDLLADYRPAGGSLFATGRHALLADGVADRVVDGDPCTLSDRVRELLAGHGADALAIGALPFDLSAPVRLHRPERMLRGGPLAVRPDAARRHAFGPRWRLAPVGDPADYAAAVDRAVSRLRAGAADKVVLARAVDAVCDDDVDLAAIVGRLAAHDPNAYTFAVDVGDDAEPAVLLGASPELLARRRGDVVTSHPLAGSAARSDDPAEDRRRGEALLRSEKDLHEHALVVDAVRHALTPLCPVLEVPAAPRLVATGTMWHLGTRITGRLADPGTTALDVALALHPTPAVCGTPAPAAAQMIAELEPFDRGLYAGAVGWQDARGDGEWAVTIRCAMARGGVLRLFGGAGVVPASRGADELVETDAKLATMLSVLRLDGDGV